MGDRKTMVQVSSFLIVFFIIFSTFSLTIFFTSAYGDLTENSQTEFYLSSTRSNNPESTIQFPNNNSYLNSMLEVSGSAMDNNGSGISLIELSILCVNENMFWRGTTWTNQETWLAAEGTTSWTFNSTSVSWISGYRYLIRSRAMDNNHNFEEPSAGTIVYMDFENPGSSILTPGDNSWVSELISINGTAWDSGGGGIEKIELTIFHYSSNNYWTGTTWSEDLTWLDVSGTDTWSYDTSAVDFFTDEMYELTTRAIDHAGNEQSPITQSAFIFDNTKPKVSSIAIDNDKNYTNTRNVKVTIELNEEPDSFDAYEMCFSFNNQDWTAWEPFTTIKQFQLSTGNGKRTIYLQVKDLAGNIAKPISDSIILDTVAPEIADLKLNFNNKYTNSILLDFELDGYDLLSGIAEMSFSFDDLTWTTWEPYKPLGSIFLPLGDGTKILYFKVKDHAGNIGNIISDTVILDTTPPQELEMIINDGKFGEHEQEQYTNSDQIQLYLGASDTLSGIHQMSFSFNGNGWTGWEEFRESRTITLTSEGVNTIYFRVSDKAGNTAEIFDQIILDKTPPLSLYIWINNGAKTTYSTTLILEHLAQDDLSGISQVSYSQDGYTWTAWADYSSINQLDLPADAVEGEKFVYFRVMDFASNIADPISASIYLYLEPEMVDTDRDGISDELDAFPMDPAASVDTDCDGYPDYWNVNMTENNSNSGLWLDAFPTDPAASVDTDGDEYPDAWNPGMTSEHSVLNLKLDAYPNDPTRYKEPLDDEKFNWNLVFILMTIILLIFVSLCSTVLRSGKMRLKEPYNKNELLKEITLEVLADEASDETEHSDVDLNIILERKYIGGEISENLYGDIKTLLTLLEIEDNDNEKDN